MTTDTYIPICQACFIRLADEIDENEDALPERCKTPEGGETCQAEGHPGTICTACGDWFGPGEDCQACGLSKADAEDAPMEEHLSEVFDLVQELSNETHCAELMQRADEWMDSERARLEIRRGRRSADPAAPVRSPSRGASRG